MLFFLFLLGIGILGRLSTGYILALDLVCEEQRRTVGAICFTLESATILIYGLYYYQGGKDSLLFILISLGVILVSLFLCLFLTESPQHLYQIKDYDKLRSTLKYINKFNVFRKEKVKPEHFLFKAEAQDRLSIDIARLSIEAHQDLALREQIKHVFFSGSHLKKLAIVNLYWIIGIFSVTTMLFMVKYLPGNKYLNIIFLSIAFILSPIVGRVLQMWISTKMTYLFFSVLALVLIPIYFLVEQVYEDLTFIFMLSIGFAVKGIDYTNLYSPHEYFESKYSNLTYSVCNLSGRAAAVVAAIVVEVVPNPLYLIFGLCLLIPITLFGLSHPIERAGAYCKPRKVD